MNRTWAKRLLYGTVVAVALLAVAVVAVPRTAEAFGPGGGMRGGMGGGMGGELGGMRGGPVGGIAGGIADRGVHLAEALGISVDELHQSMQKAAEARMQQALEDGRITQEQADLMQAGMKLRDYIDRQEVLATALGISVDELSAALEDGTLKDLIDEMGIDRETLHENMQAAMEAAIDQAVADGVITAEQAEALKEAKDGHGGRGMKGARGGRGGFPGRGGERQGDGSQQDFSGGLGAWSGDYSKFVVTGDQ